MNPLEMNNYWLADVPFANIRLILLLAFLLMTAIFLFFTISIVRYQRRYLQIQKERTKAEVATLEKERQKIAGELHDSLGPMLSAVKLQINSLDTQIPDDLEIIDKVGGYIDKVMNSIRSVSNSLAPKLLVRKGLSAAIEELVERSQADFSMIIEYKPADIPRLADDYELHIYRILQEVIHNTAKHANCKKLIIRLFIDKQYLVLLTADDGKGFDPDAQKETGGGLGLRNIETRNEILNGRMQVNSKYGEGSKYIFEFPLQTLLAQQS